jgi:hypothetical protein
MSDNAAELALQALAAELVIELSAAKAIELAGGLEITAPGTRDPYGQFQPPPPGPQSGWHHTLRNPAHRQHLLGADPFMNELYGRAPGPGRQAAQGASAAGGVPGDLHPRGILAEGPPGGQQQGQQAQGGVHRDLAGLPLPGSDARGHADGGGTSGAGDVELIPHPAGPAARPQRRPARNMYGSRRRLKYTGR